VLSLTHETHLKQLDLPCMGSSRVFGMPNPIAWIQPELTVKPARTCYERRAHTYEFVRDVLDRARTAPGGGNIRTRHRAGE